MAANLRNHLIARYHIDHVIELQLLVAPFIEKGYDVENEDDIKHMLEFIEIFQDIWNTEIKTQEENIKKAQRVRGYLQWRYGHVQGELSREIDKVIGDIRNLYESQHDNYGSHREYVRDKLRGKKGNYLEIEDRFNLLLTNRNIIRNINLRTNVSLESIERLVNTLSKQINMDHIVELQLLAYVLHQTNVADESLRKRFVNCFHKKFNIRGIPRFCNEDKGITVKKWLTVLEEGGEPINHIDERVVRYVANHYTSEENRNIVLGYIENDNDLDPIGKQQLHETEMYLFNLLNDFMELFERNKINNT